MAAAVEALVVLVRDRNPNPREREEIEVIKNPFLFQTHETSLETPENTWEMKKLWNDYEVL